MPVSGLGRLCPRGCVRVARAYVPEVAEVGEKCPYDGLGLAAVEALEVIRRAADVVAEKPQYWVTGDAESGAR